MNYKLAPNNQIGQWDEILKKYVGYKENGYFVEVGAFDGVQWSPCYPLAQAGWSGIFFEPLMKPFLKLKKNYEGNDNILCERKAISDFAGQAEMFLGGSLSTLEASQREAYLDIDGFSQTGHAEGKKEIVWVSMLDTELYYHGAAVPLDVVSIDVEGSELKVLDRFSLDVWQPTLVVIETHARFHDERLSGKAAEIDAHMHANNYGKTYVDQINTVYVNERSKLQRRLETIDWRG